MELISSSLRTVEDLRKLAQVCRESGISSIRIGEVQCHFDPMFGPASQPDAAPGFPHPNRPMTEDEILGVPTITLKESLGVKHDE